MESNKEASVIMLSIKVFQENFALSYFAFHSAKTLLLLSFLNVKPKFN